MTHTKEINGRGNEVVRTFIDGDRYRFDFDVCSRAKGWTQYDTNQDASYFGVWVHPVKRQTLTYAEGDVIIVKCPTVESYKAELKDMADFFGPPPPAYIVLDPENNTKTNFYDERPV